MTRILVIDDDAEIRQVLQHILERAGYEVRDAADGRQGLECVRAEPIDLVVTDIIMPEKEGIETIRELQADCPDVKIIAISGGGRVSPYDYLEMAQKFGAVKTFEKPFEWDELIMAIDEILDQNED